MVNLVEAMKMAHQYNATVLGGEYRRGMLQAAHTIAVDSKNLLDTYNKASQLRVTEHFSSQGGDQTNPDPSPPINCKSASSVNCSLKGGVKEGLDFSVPAEIAPIAKSTSAKECVGKQMSDVADGQNTSDATCLLHVSESPTLVAARKLTVISSNIVSTKTVNRVVETCPVAGVSKRLPNSSSLSSTPFFPASNGDSPSHLAKSSSESHVKKSKEFFERSASSSSADCPSNQAVIVMGRGGSSNLPIALREHKFIGTRHDELIASQSSDRLVPRTFGGAPEVSGSSRDSFLSLPGDPLDRISAELLMRNFSGGLITRSNDEMLTDGARASCFKQKPSSTRFTDSSLERSSAGGYQSEQRASDSRLLSATTSSKETLSTHKINPSSQKFGFIAGGKSVVPLGRVTGVQSTSSFPVEASLTGSTRLSAEVKFGDARKKDDVMLSSSDDSDCDGLASDTESNFNDPFTDALSSEADRRLEAETDTEVEGSSENEDDEGKSAKCYATEDAKQGAFGDELFNWNNVKSLSDTKASRDSRFQT